MNSSAFKLVVKIIVGIVLFLVIFAGLAFVYGKLTGTPINVPNLKEMKTKMPSFRGDK